MIAAQPETTGKRFGTRAQLATYLTDRGFPISRSKLNKLCMPSANEGPQPAYWWARRPIYDLDAALEWARARCRVASEILK
jgi:hypothetical protein